MSFLLGNFTNQEQTALASEPSNYLLACSAALHVLVPAHHAGRSLYVDMTSLCA